MVKLSSPQNKTVGAREMGKDSMASDKSLLPQEEGLLQTYKIHLQRTKANLEMRATQKQCVPQEISEDKKPCSAQGWNKSRAGG